MLKIAVDYGGEYLILGQHYPNPVFWKMAGEEQAPVTFGCDAHDTCSSYDADSLEKAQNMVEKYGLNYIGMPEIRPIQKT